MAASEVARLATAGWNFYGQCLLRIEEEEDEIAVPTITLIAELLPDGRTIALVAVGDGHSLFLDNCGHMWALGANDCGQLGRGHVDDDHPDNCALRPVTGTGDERVVLIAVGYCHSAAVTECGRVYAWGDNEHGQCGAVTTDDSVAVATHCALGALAGADVCAVFVACGGAHTVALTSEDDGSGVIAFGRNGSGQLGTGNLDSQSVPVRLASAVLGGVRVVGCAAGNDFTHLVSDGGRVFAMGQNTHGQLGTGDTNMVDTPTEIDAGHFDGVPIAAVACGTNHVLALTRERKLYAFGGGSYGVTGLGHTDDATTPQRVVGALAGARVVRLAAGYEHSCALADDGRVFGVGRGVGVPAAGVQGTPLLLQGALTDTTVRALGVGCNGLHTVFTMGTPPADPGFDLPVTFVWLQRHLAWRRRRTLLTCLLARNGELLVGGTPPLGAAPAATTAATAGTAADAAAADTATDAAAADAAAPSTDVLLRVASLPVDLWKGPLIFKFL